MLIVFWTKFNPETGSRSALLEQYGTVQSSPHSSHRTKMHLLWFALTFQDRSLVPHISGPRQFHSSILAWLLRLLSLWKVRGHQVLKKLRHEKVFWTSLQNEQERCPSSTLASVCPQKSVTAAQNWILYIRYHLAQTRMPLADLSFQGWKEHTSLSLFLPSEGLTRDR